MLLLKFNQVLTNISTRDVTTGVEVDSDEFSLKIFFYHPVREDLNNLLSLTNLEELSFLTVLALPKASRIGLALSSCCSSSP